jgi:hypothetical protein
VKTTKLFIFKAKNKNSKIIIRLGEGAHVPVTPAKQKSTNSRITV